MIVLAASIAQGEQLDDVHDEEYPVYDRVIEAKFLTSDTPLVLIRRTTATTVGPAGIPFTRQFFEDHHIFDGRLPDTLVTDFLLKAAGSATLHPRFHFGVRYRLVASFEGGGREETGVFSLPVGSIQFLPIVPGPLMLEFSRVAFGSRNQQALVYVGNYRVDATGAGFLVWLERDADAWSILDTEIVWTSVPLEDR